MTMENTVVCSSTRVCLEMVTQQCIAGKPVLQIYIDYGGPVQSKPMLDVEGVLKWQEDWQKDKMKQKQTRMQRSCSAPALSERTAWRCELEDFEQRLATTAPIRVYDKPICARGARNRDASRPPFSG